MVFFGFFIGVIFGSFDNNVCRLDMEGISVGGMVGDVLLWELVCFVLWVFVGDEYVVRYVFKFLFENV